MPAMSLLSTGDRRQVLWIFTNFYIHFGLEMSLLYFFDYRQWKGGWSKFNAFVQAYASMGKYDRRYSIEPPTEYGSNVDKSVLAVLVPAGIVDGVLCCFWLNGILNDMWYRYPTQLAVSSLHAFGTLVFWGDELFPCYMSWFKGKGCKWLATDGPKSIHWWWALLGSQAMQDAMNNMKSSLDARTR